MMLKISFENCTKLFIYFIILYLICDFTTQYLRYKTVVNSELKYFKGKELPSLTLCRKDHDWKFVRKMWTRVYESEIIYQAYQFDYLNANEYKSFGIYITFFDNIDWSKSISPFGNENNNQY